MIEGCGCLEGLMTDGQHHESHCPEAWSDYADDIEIERLGPDMTVDDLFDT